MKNLVELLPGEHLAASVGRIHILSANGSLLATSRSLGLKSALIRPHRLYHQDDFRLNQLFSDKGIRESWKEHGLGHYLSPFLLRNESTHLEAVAEGAASLTLRVAGQRSVWPRPWRWCPDCLEEDQDLYGVAYYHRDHQIPGVFHCSRHQLGLVSKCDDCGYESSNLTTQPLPPYDNACPNCQTWMPGYEGYFTEKMQEIETVSLRLAQGTSPAGLEKITRVVRDAIGINLDHRDSLRARRDISNWLDDIAVNSDMRAMAAYLSKTDRIDLLPLQFKNSRLYFAYAKRDPLHPLVHLITVQHAGYRLSDVMDLEV